MSIGTTSLLAISSVCLVEPKDTVDANESPRSDEGFSWWVRWFGARKYGLAGGGLENACMSVENYGSCFHSFNSHALFVLS